MDPEDVAQRLMQVYKPGDRVVARFKIRYEFETEAFWFELLIAEGSGGTAEDYGGSLLPMIRWDEYNWTTLQTSPGFIEPEAHGRRRSS
jgi:hypothetical protein